MVARMCVWCKQGWVTGRCGPRNCICVGNPRGCGRRWNSGGMWRDRCKPGRERGSGTQRDPLTHLILQCCPARLAADGSSGVCRSVGSHATSLGVFADRTVMAQQVLDWCDTPSVRRWHATPTVHVYRALSPGWATLDGLTSEVIPLDELAARLTL